MTKIGVLKHIFRDANYAVNRIFKMIPTDFEEVQILTTIFLELIKILDSNKSNVVNIN